MIVLMQEVWAQLLSSRKKRNKTSFYKKITQKYSVQNKKNAVLNGYQIYNNKRGAMMGVSASKMTDRVRRDNAVVYEVNTGKSGGECYGSFGHSVLVIRRLNDSGATITDAYDIQALSIETAPNEERGFIFAIRHFDSIPDRFSGQPRNGPYNVLPDDLTPMIGAINREITQLNHALDRALIEKPQALNRAHARAVGEYLARNFTAEELERLNFPSYQQLGSDSVLSDPDGGVNCAQWVREKFNLAGISASKNSSSADKPPPYRWPYYAATAITFTGLSAYHYSRSSASAAPPQPTSPSAGR